MPAKRKRSYKKSSSLTSGALRLAKNISYVQRQQNRDISLQEAIRAVNGVEPQLWTNARSSGRRELDDTFFGGGLYTGRGAYSLGRNWRKSGLGKTMARAGRNLITSAVSNATSPQAFTGMGAYNTAGSSAAPVLNQLISGNETTPLISESPGDETDSITFSAKQFVRIINAPGDSSFTNVVIPINPGLSELFPWLSGIASQFEEYRFNGLVFIFQSTLDTNGLVSNGQSGTVIMAADYNAKDNQFINPEEMLQYHGAISAKLTEGINLGVECDPGKGGMGEIRFVRANGIPQGDDIEEYDAGTLNLAFNNVPSALYDHQIGYLWVWYNITFLKPKLAKSRGEDIRHFLYVNKNSVTQANPLGNLALAGVSESSNIDLRLTNPTNDDVLVTFPSWLTGDFVLRMRWEGSSMTYTGINLAVQTVGGQVSLLNDIYAAYHDTSLAPHSYLTGVSDVTTANKQFIYEVHIRLKSAVGGVDNTLQIDFTNKIGGTLTQVCVELSEYCTVGHISNTNQNERFGLYNDRTTAAVVV